MTKELFDHYCRFMHSILMPPNISINFGELETLVKIITNAPVEISDIIKVVYNCIIYTNIYIIIYKEFIYILIIIIYN